ncbi:MAG: NAD(P)H-dependent glycerol-3-phosphate dehydrogenase [Treponemataceae bacterium]
MEARIGIIGAGAWGTAVAKVLADKGHDVDIWSHEPSTMEDINVRHENARFLPDVKLPENLRANTDMNAVATGKEFLILAVPSLFLLGVVRGLLQVPNIREGETTIGVITKGFLPTPRGPRLLLETLEDYLPGFYRQSLVYIAGPSHAEEVSRGRITGLIAASENAKNSIRFRELLSSSRLLVFSSFDVVGVQVCAAAKNVVAIAFGMMDAMKSSGIGGGDEIFGDGTESLLLAAGLNEIQILGKALGATHAETFTSISGVGDLDVTCRSVFGRNRRFGREIIEKNILAPYANLDDLIARISEIGYLPEGVVACKYVMELAEKHGLKMPIATGLHKILNKEIGPRDFLHAFLKGME